MPKKIKRRMALATYPNHIDNHILAFDTAVQIGLRDGRASDDEEVMVLAQGRVLDQQFVVANKRSDTIVAFETLFDKLDTCPTIGTKD